MTRETSKVARVITHNIMLFVKLTPGYSKKVAEELQNARNDDLLESQKNRTALMGLSEVVTEIAKKGFILFFRIGG